MSNTASKISRIDADAVDKLLDRIPDQFLLEKKFLIAALAIWILAIGSGGILELVKHYQGENQLKDSFKNNTASNSASLLSTYQPPRPRPLPQRFEVGALEDTGNAQCVNGPADLERTLRNNPAGWSTPYRSQ